MIRNIKTINYSLLSLFLVVISITCTVSCGEDYSSPLKGIVIDKQTFETGTNNKTVSIGTKDISKCTITSSAVWCSASIQGSSVVINVQPNETYEERQATITLTDPEDATTLSFSVVQKQNDAILIDNKSYTIPEDGGEVKIDVQSNVAYEVEIPSDADWLKKVSTRSLTSSSVVLRASKNESGDEREAKVTFVYKDTGVKTQVTISQGFTPYLEIDKDEILLDVNGGKFSIAVSTNTDIDIVRDDSWVYIQDRTDEKGFSFVQNFYVEPISSSRSTTITFRCSNTKWGLSKKVVLKQTVRFYIDDKNVTLGVGEKKNLKLVNETGKDVTWMSWNPTVATVDSKGKLTGISEGSARISVMTKDGSHSDEISVKVELRKEVDMNNISKEITLYEIGTGVVYGDRFASYIDFSITNNSKCNIEIKNMNAYSSSGNSFHNKSESINLPSGSSVDYEVVKIQDHTDYLENYFLDNTFYLKIIYINKSNMQYYTKKVRFYKSSWAETRYTIQDISD
ncbi:Putative binding domain-containing protein, N-terminal [Prevotella sp. ne3005]|uniref:BACON domain-containing protein n=1 Tax=Prevotella sp. ne3005 TaxID=1761887 RepID=UPI0008D51DCB|nr:BACON domain-containing carbohydrate-binding protein [Prevotella sp. ne3005]SEM65572.1 Putative binding domain-containing protein, N-terminal [Prevotella sp. ne3005]